MLDKDEYRYILDNTVFSFSNLQTFKNCPTEWKRRYIDGDEGLSNQWADFGKCCHEILSESLTNKLDNSLVVDKYRELFSKYVTDKDIEFYLPSQSSMYKKGLNYFEYERDNPLLSRILTDSIISRYDNIEVYTEYEFEYTLDSGHQMCGYIDVLVLMYKDSKVVNAYVIDHKSGEYPLTQATKIRSAQKEKYEQYKKQLYLYSDFVKHKFGVFPDSIILNYLSCHRYIKLQFSEEEYNATMAWVNDTINEIYETEDFELGGSYFYCHNLCSYRDDCY